MKKVLLLGDSIRIGYQEMLKELLKDECEVIFCGDNGRFSAYTLWQANQMFKNYGHFDLVHWNNGYWDMNIEAPMTEPMMSIDEYLHFLRRIIALCRQNADKIVFATTPPVLEKGSAMDNTDTGCYIFCDNDLVRAYNSAAKALMAAEKIPVNDIYEIAIKGENYYKCPDKLHLTKEGYMLCAKQAAEIIRKELSLTKN